MTEVRTHINDILIKKVLSLISCNAMEYNNIFDNNQQYVNMFANR